MDVKNMKRIINKELRWYTIEPQTEAELQTMVADYIRTKYPDVLFHSDFGSGIKLTKGQAIKQKRQNGGRRGWPDMFIAEPVARCVDGGWNMDCGYYGLFLELKKAGTRLVKVRHPDEWENNHIAEQASVLRQLQSKGYCAEFAVGFEQAKQIIDHYLRDAKNEDWQASLAKDLREMEGDKNDH